MSLKNKPPAILVTLAFIAIYFVWGTSYLAIVYALKGLPPFTISALRYLAAGGILTCWLYYQKAQWPQGKDRTILIISGILMLSGGSGLVVLGEQYISSGFAAVVMATEPLFFVLFDRGRWKKYFSDPWIPAGLLLGFAGIALFACFAPDEAAKDHRHIVLGTLITLISAVSWVIGALLDKHRLSSTSGTIANSTMQLLAAGTFSGVVALAKGELPVLWSTSIPGSAWCGLAYLVIMGSLVAYLSFNWLIKVQPPAIVSTHTYVNPIIAVLMGWALAGEQVSSRQIAAFVIVLTGVIITQASKQK